MKKPSKTSCAENFYIVSCMIKHILKEQCSFDFIPDGNKEKWKRNNVWEKWKDEAWNGRIEYYEYPSWHGRSVSN